MLHDGVHDIKAKLDGKLAELGSLVTELGGLPRKFGKLCEENAEPTEHILNEICEKAGEYSALGSKLCFVCGESGKQVSGML